MVVKSIHSSKDVSKRNGFLFDYLDRRKVNFTVERQANISITVPDRVKFLNVWKDSGKVHPCTGTETLYRLYGPYGE
jgi:hypothetical protein